jgi:nicotinamidase/pyrazinamidase
VSSGTIEGKTALIAVDVQRDRYAPGGARSVHAGEDVVAPLAARAADADVVVVTQGGPGAEIHPDLARAADVVVHKGEGQQDEGVSAFEGQSVESGKPLADELRDRGVTKLQVGGLATDDSVRATVLGGLAEGFEVTALVDAMRAVEAEPGDGERAVAQMVAGGARLARDPGAAS